MPQKKTTKTHLTLIDYVKVYADAGYGTFATTRDKRPAISTSWKDAKIDDAPNMMKYPFGQFGVRLKADDLIIDLDPRNMKNRSIWGELKQQISTLNDIEKQATIVRTGGGGLHVYLRKPPQFKIRKNLKEFPGVDFLTEGAYVIGAGSRVEEKGYSFITAPFMEVQAPGGLLNLIKRQAVDLGVVDHKGFNDTEDNIKRFKEYVKTLAPVAVEGEQGDKTTFTVACRGRDYNLTMQKTFNIMAKDYNPKCQPMWKLSELERKVHNAYNYNAAPPGTRDPQVVLPDMDEGAVENTKWLSQMDAVYKNKKLSHYKPTFRNARLLLENDRHMKGMFIYNLFNERLEVKGQVPWATDRVNMYNAVDDREVELIRLYLARTYGGVEFSSSNMWKAVDLEAASKAYHPIRDILNTYTWDKVPRIDTWLRDYCGTKDTELTRQIGRKVLCAMIGRVFNPGCKFDYVLVLEGAQGIGKSTCCEILGGAWYGDTPIDPGDKDIIPYIHSKWVVELSEMVTTRRTEADRLKNFLSRKEDDVRLPYARTRQRFARQCIFIGTINPDDAGYLVDTTGNRRFWPVYCERFDLEGLKREREQLLAEALVAYKAGEELTIPEHLFGVAEEEANKRLADDPWTWVVAEWAETCPEVAETTTQHLYKNVLNGQVQHMHTGHQRRIGASLRKLGWRKLRRLNGVVWARPLKVKATE